MHRLCQGSNPVWELSLSSATWQLQLARPSHGVNLEFYFPPRKVVANFYRRGEIGEASLLKIKTLLAKSEEIGF